MDLRLPDIDGVEILREIKENAEFKEIPIIIRTGSHDPRDEDACKNLGILDYMVKKVGFETIEEQTQIIHDYWASL